jgi:hypothetical protein
MDPYKLLSAPSLPEKRLNTFSEFLDEVKFVGRCPTLPKPSREKLETLYNSGLTLSQIGKIFGASSSTVQRWMVKYGIKRRESSWSEEETVTLKEFYPRGEKETLVARLGDRTWEGIKQKATKLGLRFPRTKYIFSKEELEKLYNQMGALRASEYFEVGRDTFYYLLKKNGISTKKRGCPNLRPSVDLLYLLGVLKGDGFTRIREKAPCYYLIGLGTISEKFARAFADALRSIGLNPHFYSHNPPSGHSKEHISYSVKASSKKFVKNLGLSGKTGKGRPYWYLHKCGKDVLNLIDLIKPCIRNEPSNLNRVGNKIKIGDR